MTQDPPSKKKVRFIKPPNMLKQKVGTGGIDPALLEKSQGFIDNSDLDFAPYAEDFLKTLSQAIKDGKKDGSDKKEIKDRIIYAVMQLKANGGMFRYRLVSDVADIALQFMEAIDELNSDSFDVITAHQNTIKIIISSELKGDGGKEGYALVKELDRVCKRYFAKHQPPSPKKS